MAGIDYSQFINNLKSKYAEIVKDKKIALSEFGKLEKADQDKLSELLAGGEAAQLGDIVVVTNEYKSEDGATLELFAGRGEEGEINLTDSAKKKYKNADHGWLENGEMILLDKNGRTLVNTDGAVVKLRLKESDNKLRLPLVISAVRKEVRQFMIDLLKRMYTEKKDEFTNYLFSSRPNFFKELGMTLHDLGSMTADKLTELGIVVDRGDTRWEIREKLLNKTAELSILEDNLEDEEYFNEKFREYFGSDFNYEAAYDFLNHCKDFNEAKIQDKLIVAEKTDDKFSKTLNNLIKTNLKSADDYMSNSENIGGLMELATTVALMYVSGGSSAIAKYSQMAAKGANELAEVVITNTAGKKAAQSVVGQTLSQAAGITAAQTNGAAMNAVAFQMPKVAELVGETVATGHVDMDKVNVIAESAEGLFKFGYVGSAISGPLGMQVKGLTTKLLNSKPIINQILTKGITNKPTALTSVLKDISEHSEAIGEVLKFGTEFGINAGYMAYDDGTSYTDAMKNLAQMDGVSKMVIAMLGGKNLEFLTPKKVQQIKTDLAGYKVNISIYEGQKVYSVKDAKGKETVLATPEELFMFILDKEAKVVGVKAETKAETKTASSKETKNDAVAKDVKSAETTGKKPYVKSEVKVETNGEYKANTIFDKVFDETTIPKSKAILEEMGFTKEEINSIDIKDANVQRMVEAYGVLLKYDPKIKEQFDKSEIIEISKQKEGLETVLKEEAKLFTEENCEILAKNVIFDDGGNITDIFRDYNNPEKVMSLLPILTQNGKHKVFGSQLKLLGYFLNTPEDIAKITPEKVDLMYKINDQIENKKYGIELSEILNLDNVNAELANDYVKETNRFGKYGIENISEKTLEETVAKRKAVSDFLEQYPIDLTCKDYEGNLKKLSGNSVYRLSQSTNKAEVQKFVNSLLLEARESYADYSKYVDKGFSVEKLSNLINEYQKGDFGKIQGDIYELLDKMLETGSKDYDGMIDLIMAYKGTKCLDWYGNEQYVQVANGDFKGAAKYIELAKVLVMNKEHFDYLIADKNADFKTVEACLTYVKENKIDLSSYSDYCLLRDNNWKENLGKIEYLKEQGINNNLDSLHYYICTDLKSDISLKEFKEKFEFVNNFIKDNKDTDYRGYDTDYAKIKFANSSMKMGEVTKLQDLAKLANMKPAEVLELLVNANKEKMIFTEKLCADKDIPKDKIAGILLWTNKDNIAFAEKLCADKDIPKECIADILRNTSKDNIAFAEKLCADKEFPKDKIAGILGNTNKDNIAFAEKLCEDKELPTEYLYKIIKYAKDKSHVENIESIMSNSTMKNWMVENLKNGLSVENIYDLSRTQKMLINEQKNIKAAQDKTSKVKKQQKVEVEKSNDILEAENQLAKHGVHPKLAAQYVKMCVENGFINPVKYEAITKLASAGVGIKELKNIFNLAVGNNLSSANGEFRMQIIDDIVTFKQNGVLDDKLAANMSAVKNMTSAELKARLNTKVREQIKARIDGLDTEVKERLNKSGLDVDVIAKKTVAEVKLPKDVEIAPFEKVSKIQTVQLRSVDNIVGTEKVVYNKFKSEIDQSIWGDEKRFKQWAEDKIKDLMNFEIHSDYTAVGAYSSVNEKRIQGIKDWYKFLTEESSHKDDVFAHLLVIESLTKEFKPNNANVPPAVSHGAFEATYNAILEGNTSVSFSQIYAKQTKLRAIEQFSKGKQNVDGINGQWVTIPRSQKGEPNYDEHIAMVQALAEGSSWCLRFDNAHTYLQGGNLHFFVDKNGNSQIAINETDGKITQIQKRYNQDSTVPVPYASVIEEWAKKNNYHGLEKTRQTALEQKPKFDELKTKLNKLQAENNAI